jgi:hypothetical protein
MDSRVVDRYRQVHAMLGQTEVSLGYRTVALARPDDLDEAQLGYGRAPDGMDLAGTADGDWNRSWVVVGHDDECGDPVFVDTAVKDWPVYTAMHGEDRWEPAQIAVSFDAFLAALGRVRALSAGRETPVSLESNPVSDSERADLLESIEKANPGCELVFWESWLEV